MLTTQKTDAYAWAGDNVPEGVRLTLTDDLLTVEYPDSATAHDGWDDLVSACHYIAGENGVGLRFEAIK